MQRRRFFRKVLLLFYSKKRPDHDSSGLSLLFYSGDIPRLQNPLSMGRSTVFCRRKSDNKHTVAQRSASYLPDAFLIVALIY